MNIGSWVAANWKLVTGIAAVSGTIGTAAVNHVVAADERMDRIEIQAVRDSAQLEVIERDVSDVKCMVVQQAQEEDPLECLQD